MPITTRGPPARRINRPPEPPPGRQAQEGTNGSRPLFPLPEKTRGTGSDHVHPMLPTAHLRRHALFPSRGPCRRAVSFLPGGCFWRRLNGAVAGDCTQRLHWNSSAAISDLLRPMSATAPGTSHTVGESNAAAAKEYRRRRRVRRRRSPHCPLGSRRHLLHHRPAPLLPFQVRRVHIFMPPGKSDPNEQAGYIRNSIPSGNARRKTQQTPKSPVANRALGVGPPPDPANAAAAEPIGSLHVEPCLSTRHGRTGVFGARGQISASIPHARVVRVPPPPLTCNRFEFLPVLGPLAEPAFQRQPGSIPVEGRIVL